MLLLRKECSCFGKNAPASAGMLLLRQECFCFGKNALASARMLMLRQECSCFGKNAPASARMLLLRQECSCFGKNALASARMLLLRQECSCFGKNAPACHLLLGCCPYMNARAPARMLGRGGGKGFYNQMGDFTIRWKVFTTTEPEITQETVKSKFSN